ncbi:AGRL1-like protein, partial [Mya arenaria]
MAVFSNDVRISAVVEFTMFYLIEHVKESLADEDALSIITYIGCSVSILTLFMAVTVFTCIRSIQSERIFVHRNLCIALLSSQVLFLAGINAVSYKVVCRVMAVVLHYSFTAVFTWMLVEGLHLYTQVIQVFQPCKSRENVYLAFGWGIPLLLVATSLAADFDGYGSDKSCWLSVSRHTIWAFVGPAGAVMIVNGIILLMVLNIVFTSSKNDSRSNLQQLRAGAKAALFLLPLMGVTWFLGLLVINKNLLVFEYLFAICNSLQGFLVFLFHCVLNT